METFSSNQIFPEKNVIIFLLKTLLGFIFDPTYLANVASFARFVLTSKPTNVDWINIR